MIIDIDTAPLSWFHLFSRSHSLVSFVCGWLLSKSILQTKRVTEAGASGQSPPGLGVTGEFRFLVRSCGVVCEAFY